MICWGVILPIQLPRGIHEIQPLEICADFGCTCGRDPRKGAATLIWICHRGWGGACRSLCFLHRLGKVVIGAAQDQRCHTDLISILENLCGFEARLPACRLQIGRGLPNIQPPVDLSCCQQSWAVPAPVDLWALICGQKDACSMSITVSLHILAP